jgi:MFS transporter, FHS family, glucose/mannose:H+ symporter
VRTQERGPPAAVLTIFMSAFETPRAAAHTKALTLAAYTSFLPIGVVTVLLGPMLPMLSARWSLNYSQAGALFTVQYLASTAAVALTGALVSRRGYRFAMIAGLLPTAAGVSLLRVGSRLLGMICIAAYGAGLGLAVPPANLLVAEANPHRRSAALNLLNFCWSAGAVACPFLVAAAAKGQRVPLLLVVVAGFLFLVAIGIAATPSSTVEPVVLADRSGKTNQRINWRHPALPVLAAVFFIYIGTENGVGGWVASYAKTLGTITPAMSLMTPSFFYAALMLGRWLAPPLLRRIDDVRLVQAGLLVACGGTAGLVWSRNLLEVGLSAGLTGLGLSVVYPISISLLSREFGPAGSRVGSLMFTLAYVGGGLLPWLVGVSSNQFGTLKAGLAVPWAGGGAMLLLFLRGWTPAPAKPQA